MKTTPIIHKIAAGEYRLDLRGKTFANLLALVSNGKKTLQFETLTAAEKKAEEIGKLVESHGRKRLENVSKIIRDDVDSLYAKLNPFNRTLTEAVDHFVAHLIAVRKAESTETMNAMVDRWLEAKLIEKEKGTLRQRTYQTLKFFGGKFKAHWGNRRIGTITKHDVKEWLSNLHTKVEQGRLQISSTYEKHHLSHLSQFFIWCKKNYNHTLLNPCETLSVKYETEDPTFFSVEQATEFLKLSMDKEHVELVPFHAICLFAGVRPKECERLTWDEIDFDDNCIVMIKGNAKTKTGRRPEILPLLATWLKWYQAKYPKAPLIPMNFKRKVQSFRTAFGAWQHNVLRHSFASYYLAGVKKDFGALEATLGNSRLILQKHYVQFPSKNEAVKFWGLTPEKVLPKAA